MKSSVLAITSELPWPLDSGGRLRTFHVQKALAAAFDLRLVVPVRPEQAEHVETLRTQGIHVIPVFVPTRTKWAEAKRLVQARLRGEPYVMFGRHMRREVAEAWNTELNFQPDVVWLDHIDSLQFKPPRAKAVIDLHNIYSLILDRMAGECGNPVKRMVLRGEAKRLAAMERRAMACDAVIAVSDSEAAHFRKLGGRIVIVAPNGVDCGAFQELPTGRMNAKPAILFLGTMNWGPNVSAAIALASEIFPKVRTAMPEAELWLVGKDPCETVKALSGNGVTVSGSVPSILPYLKEAAVMAVPLDAGGGTRLKILEAFAAGLPVISTAVGAEGIDATPGEHFILAERDGMAAAILRLLCDPSDGVSLAENARSLASGTYDWQRIGAVCVETVQRLVS